MFHLDVISTNNGEGTACARSYIAESKKKPARGEPKKSAGPAQAA
jgi:hypothetical protein